MTTEQVLRTLTDLELQERATELGFDPYGPRATLIAKIEGATASAHHGSVANGTATSETPNNAGKPKKDDKDAKKKAKKRRRKKRVVAPSRDAAAGSQEDTTNGNGDEEYDDEDIGQIDIEYVPEALELDPAYSVFANVFAKFHALAPKIENDGLAEPNAEQLDHQQAPMDADDTDATKSSDEDDDEEGGQEDGNNPLSKKRLKKLMRLSVAELKRLARKPEVVEWVDVTAADAKLLVHLKSYRNTVPVPVHWSAKRKYLQGKRGTEKPPFELPEFIRETGIMEMRNAMAEVDDAGGLKGRQRGKMKPKMGRLDIDYQKLHDAFFRFQTKPKLSRFGDMYYEGKEFETKVKVRRPGTLSEELIAALNIPPLAPPPWLISMQRFGPPPSYPLLKIPGLNAPIPEGAQWGYHPGGWGKPPVDELNRPLYGDVFGVAAKAAEQMIQEPISKELWGEMDPEEEEEEREESLSEFGVQTPLPNGGLSTPSGTYSSMTRGLQTPDMIQLRKEKRDDGKQLYTVIPEKQTSIRGFMGSQHGYDMSGASGGGVQLALNPEDLEKGLDSDALKRKYQETMAPPPTSAGGNTAAAPSRWSTGPGKEDVSDLVQEHESKKRARKEGSSSKDSSGRKHKDFKF